MTSKIFTVLLLSANLASADDRPPADDVDAAIASDAIATPYHACHKEAQLSPGDDVLVTGAGGGVGIHMVQMARLCGARVIAAEVSEEKLALAREWAPTR